MIRRIPREDRRRFLFLALSFSLTQAVTLMIYLVALTHFLKVCGAARLPWAYLAGYLFSLCLSQLLRRAQAHMEPLDVLFRFYAFYVAVFLAGRVLGAGGGPELHGLLMSAALPLPSLLMMLFWNVPEGTLSLQQGKIWSPLITALAFPLQVLVGLLIGPVGRLVGLANLYLLGAFLLLASHLLLRESMREAVRQEAAAPAGEEPVAGPRVPLVGSLAAIVSLIAMFKYLLEFHLSRVTELRYGTPLEISEFLGRWDAIGKGSVFVTQWFLTTSLLEAFPPGRVMAAMSLGILGGSFLVLGGYPFPGVLLASYVFTLFEKGINRSAMNLLLAPLPPSQARQVRVILEGQVYGRSFIAVSLATALLSTLLAPAVTFSFLLLAGTVYLLLCFRVDNQYVSALHDNLQAADPGVREEALRSLRPCPAGERVPILEEMLASGNPDRRMAAVDEIRDGRLPAGTPLLMGALAREENPKVLAAIARALPDSGATAEDMYPLLSHDAPRVQANVLEGFARLSGTFPGERLSGFLRSEHPRVRAAAGLAILRRSTRREELHQALTTLDDMARSAAHEARAAACFALGRLGHRALVEAVIGHLQDPDPGVRRQAVMGLRVSRDPRGLLALEKALSDPANASLHGPIQRALDRIQDRTLVEVATALGHLDREDRRALASQVGQAGLPFARLLRTVLEMDACPLRRELLEVMKSATTPESMELLSRCVTAGTDGPAVGVRPVLERALGPAPGEWVWELLYQLRRLDPGGELPRACKEQAQKVRERISPGFDPEGSPEWQALLKLLGVTLGDPSVEVALRLVPRKRDRRVASLAVELLEKQVGDRELREELVALVGALGAGRAA